MKDLTKGSIVRHILVMTPPIMAEIAPDAPITGAANPGLNNRKISAPAMPPSMEKAKKRKFPIRAQSTEPNAKSHAALKPR